MTRDLQAPERHPLVDLLIIATPTVITMTSYTVMGFVDGLMVTRIGSDDVYLAAQGNGGMIVWLLMSFTLGITHVINTYVAQNLGAGRLERGASYAWAGLWISLVGGLLILPVFPFLGRIFASLDHDPALVELETTYASVLLLGAALPIGARAMAQYFYGMHRPVVVMVSVLIANVVNITSNGVLIFGLEGATLTEDSPWWWVEASGLFQSIAELFGIHAMGVKGAAIGTVIGTVTEVGLPFLVFVSGPWNRRFKTRGAWRTSLGPVRDVLKLGWPAGLMFANDMITIGYLMIVLLPTAAAAGGMDPQLHNTAGWIGLRYMHISFMPAVGISIAITALVGKSMGMRRPDLAAQRGWLGVKVTLAYMGTCAILFLLFRRPMAGLFVEAGMPAEQAAELIRVASTVLVVAATFQLFDALAITLSGALRGAGDTVWPGIVSGIAAWVCIVGGGHLMIAIAPGLGSLGPWMALGSYFLVISLCMLWRWSRGGWRKIDLLGEGIAVTTE